MLTPDMRRRLLKTASHHLLTLEHIAADLTQEQATTLRDGENGWNTVEILCHLRDFDHIFRERAQRILAEQEPSLAPVDHEALVSEREYGKQELQAVLAQLRQSREATLAFFEGLADADWSRAGLHPERGRFSLDDALLQVVTHDADHTEQLTRVLRG